MAADLHVGLEHSMSRKGVRVPLQSSKMAGRLASIAISQGCRDIVLLGDLKDQVSGASPATAAALADFFQRLSAARCAVTLVPGNHDGDIARALPQSVGLASAGGMLLSDEGESVALLHGHAMPSEAVAGSGTFVVGHRHFALRSGRATVPLWVRGEFGAGRRLVVVPPFNELLPGSSPKQAEGERSFVAGALSAGRRMQAFTLDGTCLGELSALAEVSAGET